MYVREEYYKGLQSLVREWLCLMRESDCENIIKACKAFYLHERCMDMKGLQSLMREYEYVTTSNGLQSRMNGLSMVMKILYKA